MTKYIITQTNSTIISKLSYQSDLLEELTQIALKENISLGKIEAIGAVSEAAIAFYNQKTFKYQKIKLEESYEITSFLGNITLKEKKPIIHAHLTLADDKGKVFGGHLLPGTIVFACEAIITVFHNGILERGFDKNTKLPLWNL